MRASPLRFRWRAEIADGSLPESKGTEAASQTGSEDTAVAAEFATRAVRRARIAVNPLLDDNDVSAAGLATATEIAEAFAVICRSADQSVAHAGVAEDRGAECARTMVAQDAQELATQVRAAAMQAVHAAEAAVRLAPGAYSTGATAAPDRADDAVTAATVADRAVTKAELHAERRKSSETVRSLHGRSSA